MKAWLTLLSMCALPLACQAAPTTTTDLTTTAKASGDIVIVGHCQLRSEKWISTAIKQALADLAALANEDLKTTPTAATVAAVTAMIAGANLQATSDGDLQWHRYGKASCEAIAADGSLARLDAQVIAADEKTP